jgi:hypothetical protein
MRRGRREKRARMKRPFRIPSHWVSTANEGRARRRMKRSDTVLLTGIRVYKEKPHDKHNPGKDDQDAYHPPWLHTGELSP